MDLDDQADEAWLLSVQRKLYQWSRIHPEESYRDLWNWITDLGGRLLLIKGDGPLESTGLQSQKSVRGWAVSCSWNNFAAT